MPHPPLGELKASDGNAQGDHTLHGMGGLVLGTTVHGPIAKDVVSRRKIRLVVQQYDSIPGEFAPPFSYRLDDEKKLTNPGPPIVVQRNEPIAITVVNRAKEPTSVHWHGLEIESYYDGVPGFGGNPGRTTPLVMPGDSFVVKMIPPRAGTFIYHSHADETRQQGAGLYGAFIVLDRGAKWDPEHDRPIVISVPRDSGSILINGETHPTLDFKAGESYRLRLINITLARPSIYAALTDGTKPLEWNVVAKDGADLPAHQAGMRPAKLTITIGETYDLLFTPAAAGDYALEIRTGGGVLLRSATFRVQRN
jgi:FtsP/CotA-like multicopper oxidase with cupredoxin domain